MMGSVVASMKRDASSRSAFHEEAHDAAEARHLAHRDVVIRVARQAGIEDALDAGMRLEPGRHAEGRLVLASHAQVERLGAAQEKVRRVRIEDGTEHSAEVAQAGDEGRLPRERAGEEVVVAAEVLRGRVEDEVHAELDGALVDGRRERGIDEDLHAGMPIADGDEARKVHDPEVRVRGRFGQDEARLSRPDRALERLVIPRLDERVLDAPAGQHRRDELPRPTIAVGSHDDVLAALQEGEERRRRRRHPAREKDAVFGAVQLGDLPLRRPDRRVSVTAVFLALDSALEVVVNLRGALESVRGRADDRLRDGVERVLPPFAAPRGARSGARRLGGHRAPPAIAGTMETESPSATGVLRPSRKRMSSSLT